MVWVIMTIYFSILLTPELYKLSGGTLPEELEEVQLLAISTDTCQRWHGFHKLYNKNVLFAVTDSHICTGYVEQGKGAYLCDSDMCSKFRLENHRMLPLLCGPKCG